MMITVRNSKTGEVQATDEEAFASESRWAGWEQIAEGAPFDHDCELVEGAWSIPLAILQERAWEKVKAIRADHLLTAATPFGTAQTDLESMVKINGLVSMAMLAKQAAQPFAETFTMADNSETKFSADQMIGFGMAVGLHIAAVHARGRELKAAIDATASADDLGAIDLNANWP